MITDIMNGLMGATNFAGGFIQGQDTNEDRALRQQMIMSQIQQGNTASQFNNLKLQDTQQNMGYQKDRAAYAQQLATDPDTMDLPPEEILDRQAHQAMVAGDVVGQNEFITNATNVRNAKAKQAQEAVTATTGHIEQQQKLATLLGGPLAEAADEGEAAFNQKKYDLQQQGVPVPPMAWDKDLGRRLRVGGMTAQQNAQDTLAQLRLNQQQLRERDLEEIRKQRVALQEATLKLKEDTAAAKTKAGGTQKAPTKADMEAVLPYLAEVGMSPKDPNLGKAQQDVISIKAMIQKANPNIPNAQAYQQAIQKLQAAGEIQTTPVPSKLPFNLGSPTNKVSYAMHGATPDSPIKYNGNRNSLIPGRYYEHGDKNFPGKVVVSQFNGTDFDPASPK